MIYPCNYCLVDVMCLDVCDKFIWYMDEIAIVSFQIPVQRDHPIFEILSPLLRYRRARDCALRYQRSVRLFDFLIKARKQLVHEIKSK